MGASLKKLLSKSEMFDLASLPLQVTLVETTTRYTFLQGSRMDC